MSAEIAEIDREAVIVSSERRPPMPVIDDRPLPVEQHACPKLSEALALARDRCKMAHKDKTNSFHKYSYASADEVIQTAKDALAGTGLAIIPQVQELTVLGAGNVALYALNRTIFLSHSSGEFVPLSVRGWPVIQEKGKPLDKAFAVALTTSLSYLLRDLLQMPRGDDADMNARNDQRVKPLPVPAPSEKPAAKEPTPAILRNDLSQRIRDIAKTKKIEPDAVFARLRMLMLERWHDVAVTTSDWDKEQLGYAIESCETTLAKLKGAPAREDDGINEPPLSDVDRIK